MKQRGKSLALMAAILLFGMACTNNPPKIQDVWWVPVTAATPDGGDIHRELMLYIQVADKDGAEDLAGIRLEGVDNGLVWKADGSVWSEWNEKGVLWVGSSRFASFGAALTEGPYVLILEDKGGREDEIPLELEGWLDEEELSRHAIEFDGKTGAVLISSPSDAWFLLPRSGEDLSPLEIPVNSRFFPADYMTSPGESFSLMLFERNRMACYRSGPYSSVE